MNRWRHYHKTVISCGFVCVLGCCLLLGVGCGGNPSAAYLYQLEKLYYQAERGASLLSIESSQIQESELLRLAGLYDAVILYYQEYKDKFSTTPGSVEATAADTLFTEVPPPDELSVRYVAATLAIRSSLRKAALLAGTDKFAEAIETYRSIPTVYPGMVDYHSVAAFELASSYTRSGQWEEALEVYHTLMYEHQAPADTISRYDVRWLELPLQIVRSYRLRNDTTAARAWLDSALIFYDRVIAEYQTGTAATLARTHAASTHRLLGEYDEAIDRYRSIVDSAGRTIPQAQLEIGNILYENLNRPDSALNVFKRLVVQRPNTEPATVAQTKIAAILIERGQYEEARDLLRPLKAAYEKRGQLVAGILLLIGRTYEAEGAWDRALNEYSWLIENFPDMRQSLDIYLHVISSMVQEDNMRIAEQWQRKAVDHFSEVIERNPETELAAAAQKNLARSWLILSEWKRAAEAYHDLIETYPGAPNVVESYLELSAIYADRLDRPEQGIEVLQALLERFPSLSFRDDIEARIDALRARMS